MSSQTHVTFVKVGMKYDKNVREAHNLHVCMINGVIII